MSLGKITLKSTTRISLNDRFTVLRNETQAHTDNGHYDSTEETRQIIQASRKNQRLAAQMERRPAVMAALKSKKNLQNRLNGQQTVSVKQRLALPGRLRVPDSYRGSLRGTRRGDSHLRVRGVRNKFQGRIGTDHLSLAASSSFRGRGGGLGTSGGGAEGDEGGPRGRGGGEGGAFLPGAGDSPGSSEGEHTPREVLCVVYQSGSDRERGTERKREDIKTDCSFYMAKLFFMAYPNTYSCT